MRKQKVYLDTSVFGRRRGINMENIVLSPDFTIDDIHKIREENYERTKNMTIAEKLVYYNTAGVEYEKEIERRRELKRKLNGK
jgi:hypothetical protein